MKALDMVRSFAKIVAVSHLYESPPMYKTDQPPFLNGVFKVRPTFIEMASNEGHYIVFFSLD